MNTHEREPSEMPVATIGLDIAKSVFQVHGVDRHGKVMLRKPLARTKVPAFFANLPRCVIGREACGGAHHWARELRKLGHEARPMPPQYVKGRRQDQPARRGRCRGLLRGGAAPGHALRGGQDRGPAGDLDAAPGARPADPPAHGDDQRAAWPSGRARDRRGATPGRPAGAARGAGRDRGSPRSPRSHGTGCRP